MSDSDSENEEELNGIVAQLDAIPIIEIPKNFIDVDEIRELYNISLKSSSVKKKEMLFENLYNLCCTLAYDEVLKKSTMSNLDIWSNMYNLFIGILDTLPLRKYAMDNIFLTFKDKDWPEGFRDFVDKKLGTLSSTFVRKNLGKSMIT